MNTTKPNLAAAHTCDLQTELSQREGVKSIRIGLDDAVTVLVNGEVRDERRGPLTVTVNWD